MVFEETIVLAKPFYQALAEVKEALAEKGFGTLTEIDLQATLSEKIGREMEPYIIVGACNPQLASRALDVEPQVGVLLPCNVVVRQQGEHVLVEAIDPGLMSQMVENPDMKPIADEARQLIGDALVRLTAMP